MAMVDDPDYARPDVLARLLVIQQTLDALPNEASIGEFTRRALTTVPGVSDVLIHIRDRLLSPDVTFEEICAQCERAGFAAAPLDSTARTVQSGVHCFPVRTASHLFGILMVRAADEGLLRPYLDFLSNIANAVGPVLDTRLYQSQLSKTNELLLKLTDELQQSNRQLEFEVGERTRAEAVLARACHAAEAANQAKNTFLANMSHELRTPLNGILGYAQILRRDTALGERQLDAVGVIQQSGEQLLTLINDILDFAKIEAGKLELSVTDISLGRFLRTIAEIISVRAGQKGLDFICDFAPDLPGGIRADETRLRQVLLNLLANAVKFTDRGQVRLRTHFSPPTTLRFAVQDTGIGVSADHLETIFLPFEQTSDPQRRLGGAGLGLAISRQFVRRMGGDIHVTSQVGAGSTFWFELEVPVVDTEVAAPEKRLVTGYDGPRKRVLVVDDLAANRAMAVEMLSQIGFDVIEAINGRGALDKAQTVQPHWILMDIVMPEMDGLEVTRRLRQLSGIKDVPIIVTSASASRSDEQKSLVAGANAFLPKPIVLDQLLTQIGSLLMLDWTYAPQAAPRAEVQAVGPLVAPPAQELELLHQLARMGNMRGIVQWAKRVAELDGHYRPLADQLHVLAKGYQSKAILTLVERYLDRRPEL
jgi:signal transduction histidine kinase/DNA-binding NarL/FixJ family response regulator